MQRKGEMRKNLLKFSVMLALVAVFCLPGMVSVDYVHPWYEIIQLGVEGFSGFAGDRHRPRFNQCGNGLGACLNQSHLRSWLPNRPLTLVCRGFFHFSLTTAWIRPVSILLSLTGLSGTELPLSDLTSYPGLLPMTAA